MVVTKMPISKARLKISDYNDQRKAKLKGRESRIRVVSLSLTSMVDMFAILVIFLLVNAGTVTQTIELGPGIRLPQAKFAEPPVKTVTLQVSKETLFGDNIPLISLNEILHQAGTIGAVKTWLLKQKPADPKLTTDKKIADNGYVTVVADEKIPFGAMKKIIATCREVGFQNVNLAVQPKS
jgi:biopolymer transport protein TolR